MSIKITIRKDSIASIAIKKHMAEKAAFANAVKKGKIKDYIEKKASTVDSTLPIS